MNETAHYSLMHAATLKCTGWQFMSRTLPDAVVTWAACEPLPGHIKFGKNGLHEHNNGCVHAQGFPAMLH